MKKPELLAPAGSVDSFYAAVDAGANAVYLGLSDFNARLRAKNFTAKDLGELVPYAHSRNVKVYVTVNTLIKQSEIKPALDLLYLLEQRCVDAAIVADTGVMKLATEHFPKLKLHGSTQMAVHNGYGAKFLKTIGAKRAVLARELTIEEIRKTVNTSPIEIEVFVHGALCYSISGYCLASSFIGGASGNRGKCTQVCRRRFKCKKGYEGYFFSPHDLQAITFIPKLIDAGVTSFKIEGRMKSAEYVDTVVKAYRRTIDFPDGAHISQALEELKFDFGREKTSFYIDGCKGLSPIDPSRPAGTGILIGRVIECGDTSFIVGKNANIPAIEKGDRLRIQPNSGFEGEACKINEFKIFDDRMIITPFAQIKCGNGDHVFLIGKGNQKQCVKNKFLLSYDKNKKDGRINFIAPMQINKEIHHITRDTQSKDSVKKTKTALWFKADSINWLPYLNASPCAHLIFDADIGEIEKLLDNFEMTKIWKSRISIALPPFIYEKTLDNWHKIIEKSLSAGIQSFTISNPGHFALVKNKNIKHIIADNPLWCLNTFTQKVFKAHGICKFVFSYEDEYLNIRNAAVSTNANNHANITGIAPVYGKPPLFISRMPPAVCCDTAAVDLHGNEFFVRVKNDLYYTLPQSHLCLFARKEKLLNCGIVDFLIDVCFHEPNHETLSRLIAAFRDGVKVEGGMIFNFKAGLR